MHLLDKRDELKQSYLGLFHERNMWMSYFMQKKGASPVLQQSTLPSHRVIGIYARDFHYDMPEVSHD